MSEFITPTSIAGLFIVKRPTFGDDRGFFREPARLAELSDAVGFRLSAEAVEPLDECAEGHSWPSRRTVEQVGVSSHGRNVCSHCRHSTGLGNLWKG